MIENLKELCNILNINYNNQIIHISKERFQNFLESISNLKTNCNGDCYQGCNCDYDGSHHSKDE
jgi:hypothetical protein